MAAKPARVVAGAEFGAPADEVLDLRLIQGGRGPLVEGHLVEAQLALVLHQQADQGLPDGARAHHMNDSLHGSS
jgi:hypothetical protein